MQPMQHKESLALTNGLTGQGKSCVNGNTSTSR